jgi:uncharacterized membrane protein
MTIRQSLLAQAGLTAASAVYSVIVRASLPDVVPTHWNIAGKPDAYGSPTASLWIFPGVLAFMTLLTWALPKMSPKQFEITRFERTYAVAMLLVSGLMLGIHVMIVGAMRGNAIDLTSGMMAILGAFFAVFGLLIGNIKQNFYMGVRTPWTLANERVWNETHRRAGPLWFYGGLVIAILALLKTPMPVLMTILLLVALWPCVDSYLLYKRAER